MDQTHNPQKIISGLKKHIDNVLIENIRAGKDVEPLVAELFSALKTHEARDG